MLGLSANRAAADSAPVPKNVAEAETLATSLAAKSAKPLRKWAEHASLRDLLYVLRRAPAELGPAEAILAEAALAQAPHERSALRMRLIARLALVDPERARGALRALGPRVVTLPLYPRASVFRISTFVPDQGDNRDFGESLVAGLRAGLDSSSVGSEGALDLRFTGEDEPARVAAAFDSAARGSGAFVGELLSSTTMVLATSARFAGAPLVSPTATDESIGTIAPNVFQIGPSGYARGVALARGALAGSTPRVAILVSSAVEAGAFRTGFEATAESLGASVVAREVYPAGSVNFRDPVRSVVAKRAEVLFWDGDPNEAEAMLRELASQHVSVRICGGEGLAPAQHHAETKALLEGIQYVADDWQLPDSTRAVIDSVVARTSGGRAGPLHVRGYLAGRLLRRAIAAGALCPEETTDRLAQHLARDPYLARHGFLDPSGEGAFLPLYVIKRGRGVPVQ